MQSSLNQGMASEIERVRNRLGESFGRRRRGELQAPIDQFIKSFIGSRTRDPVSLQAFTSLRRRYPRLSDLAAAPARAVETLIFEVTFADQKAERLGPALRQIQAEHPDFSLDFLRGLRVADALSWLETLPGVGRRIAASTLNFSTLDLPAFVVDAHVLRVLQRYGFVGPKADPTATCEAVMAVTRSWRAGDLAELHLLLKLLGQTACGVKERLCHRCPLQPSCRMANSPFWRDAPRRL